MLSKFFGCATKKAVSVNNSPTGSASGSVNGNKDAQVENGSKGSKESTVDTGSVTALAAATSSSTTSAVFSKLLGNTLLVKKGKEQSTDSLLSGKNGDKSGPKVVALYFSAHWCPPCRGFTPKLAEFYKKNLKEKGLEIVFVSSDRDEEAFSGYFAEMPWLALPFSDEGRKVKAALSEKFGISGIPALVILDGETGEVITKNGRSAVMQDPTGAKLPWKPEPVSAILDKISAVAGADFCRDNTGKKFSYEEACKGKKVGIYFSAHWCPPCRRFTPELAKWYNKVRAMSGEDSSEEGGKFEILFCSGDRDEGSFNEYFGTMPWKAIPFGTEQKKLFSQDMAQRLEVSGIPHFVILDESREILCEDGVSSVYADPEGKKFPYAV